MVIGTDTGTSANAGRIPGLAVHFEMQMLIAVGISPMKVIQGATLWNAEAIGEDKELGSVEPGKLADFTVIEGNSSGGYQHDEECAYGDQRRSGA